MYVKESVSMTTTRRQDQPQQANEERGEAEARGEERRGSPKSKIEERERREEQRLGRERVEKLGGAAEI